MLLGELRSLGIEEVALLFCQIPVLSTAAAADRGWMVPGYRPGPNPGTV